MKILKYIKLLIGVVLVPLSVFAGGNIKEVTPPYIKTANIMTGIDYNMFTYLFIGESNINLAKTGNLNFDKSVLDDKGFLAEVGIGYRYTKNMFTTLSFERTSIDKADINNIMIGLNYQFSDFQLKPYIGLLAGYSNLKWSSIPYTAIVNKDLSSDGFMFGGQVGFEQALNDRWSLIGKYQFIKYEHLLDIRSNNTILEHEYGNNILLGVQYEF